jgi:beta-lactamase class A
MSKILKKQVSVYWTILMAAVTGGSCFLLAGLHINNSETDPKTSIASTTYCSYKLTRLGGFNYVNPLLYAEKTCEEEHMIPLKSALNGMIANYKSSGVINHASIYVRKFVDGTWISINGENTYSPGSLLKIPTMMTFFKMNEKDPGLLDRKIGFLKPFDSDRNVHFTSNAIQLGKYYSYRELIKYMIVHSDNNATKLLNMHMDMKMFSDIFTDLGLRKPDLTAKEYRISALDASVFLKVLYNAAYLNTTDSEYCTSLLAQSDFKEGMVSGLPSKCKVAHKFGEGGPDNKPDFSETGIIYGAKGNYLITVMANGNNLKDMPTVVSEISRTSYQFLESEDTN